MDSAELLANETWLRFFEAVKNAIENPVAINYQQLTMPTDRLLGRTTDGTGPAEAISVTAPLTLAAGALGITGSALTRVNDTNVTATLTGTPATALLQAVEVTLGWTGQLSMARGGTAASLTAANGGLVYSTASALAITAPGTSGQIVKSAGAAAPTWNTPAALTKTDDTNVTLTLGGSASTALVNAASLTLGWTGTLGVTRGGTGLSAVATGDLYYGSAANTVSRLTATSNGFVLTLAAGLPSWATPAAAATSVVVDDTTTNATMYPLWVTASSGSLPLKVSSTKLAWNPSTGILSLSVASPSSRLHVQGATADSTTFAFIAQDSASTPLLQLRDDGKVRINSTYVAATASNVRGFTYQGVNFVVAADEGTSAGGNLFESRTLTANTAKIFLMSAPRYQDSSDPGSSAIGLFAYYSTALGVYNVYYGGSAGLSQANPTRMHFSISGLSAGTRYSGTVNAGGNWFLGDLGSTETNTARLYIRGATATNSAAALDVGDTNDVSRLFVRNDGNVGVGTTSPTATLHLKAGTATAGTAPLKLTSGTSLTTAEAGAMEYNGTNLFFTRAGTVRENVLVAIDNVAAPGTSVGIGIVNYYGSAATNFLGDPNRWLSVNVLGTTYKIPLYT